jgi:CPA2 family monovalent cation:H+ antiporter-2
LVVSPVTDVILRRAHSEAEMERLRKNGASLVVMGEHEIAKAMLEEIALPSGPGTVAVSVEPELHQKGLA